MMFYHLELEQSVDVFKYMVIQRHFYFIRYVTDIKFIITDV